MNQIKALISVVVGLFFFYIIVSFSWSLLNIQSCTSLSQKNPTCEEIAANNAQNCKYVILSWKTVDYNQELKKCKEWEQNK